MPTFVSGSSAYCTVSGFLSRFDLRAVQQLLSDTGVPISTGSLSSDPTLAVLLKEASGRIEAACLVGRRYVIDPNTGRNDLLSLTLNSAEYLAGLTARLCYWLLWSRRPNQLLGEKPPADVVLALEDLDRISSGELVFGVAENMAAGNLSSEIQSKRDDNVANATTVAAARLFGSPPWYTGSR